MWADELPEITDEVIEDYLSRGYVVSSHTNFHGTGYYMQPKMDEKGCVFLTPTGCSFTFEQRPRLCQSYVPQMDMKSCYQPAGYTLEDAIKTWKPYEHILIKYVNK